MTDLRVAADSESKGMKMDTKTPANVTTIEEATTARWLAEALEHARGDLKSIPTVEAIDRMRARALGVEAPRRAERPIAA